ncbi:MAG: hypothetical protein ACREJN_19100 [Nitrospiraceae bacterium]
MVDYHTAGRQKGNKGITLSKHTSMTLLSRSTSYSINRATKGSQAPIQSIRQRVDMTARNGIVKVPSKSPVAETPQRLEALVKSRGLTVFARIERPSFHRGGSASKKHT